MPINKAGAKKYIRFSLIAPASSQIAFTILTGAPDAVNTSLPPLISGSWICSDSSGQAELIKVFNFSGRNCPLAVMYGAAGIAKPIRRTENAQSNLGLLMPGFGEKSLINIHKAP